MIGIDLNTFGFYPRTNSTADLKATERAFDFMVGWWVPFQYSALLIDFLYLHYVLQVHPLFGLLMLLHLTIHHRDLNPLVFGDYREIMKQKARSKILCFTESQFKQLKDSIDFIGINHYSSMHFSDNHDTKNTDVRDFIGDMSVLFSGSPYMPSLLF